MTSRPPQAASPGGRETAASITHFHDAPHVPISVGCPNCRTGDKLYLIERVVIHHTVLAAATMVTLSAPELTMDGYHEDADIVAELDPTLLGVGCRNCRWSFEGANPTSKLTPL